MGPHVVRTRTSQGEALLKEDEVHGRGSLLATGQQAGPGLVATESEPSHLMTCRKTHLRFLPPVSQRSPEALSCVTSCSHTVPRPLLPVRPAPSLGFQLSPGCHPWLTRRPCCFSGPDAWSVRPEWPHQPHPRGTGWGKGELKSEGL